MNTVNRNFQWNTYQRFGAILACVFGAIPFLLFMSKTFTDVRWAIIGALVIAISGTTLRCGHLVGRINELDARIREIETTNHS